MQYNSNFKSRKKPCSCLSACYITYNVLCIICAIVLIMFCVCSVFIFIYYKLVYLNVFLQNKKCQIFWKKYSDFNCKRYYHCDVDDFLTVPSSSGFILFIFLVILRCNSHIKTEVPIHIRFRHCLYGRDDSSCRKTYRTNNAFLVYNCFVLI